MTFCSQGDGVSQSQVTRSAGYFEKTDVPKPIKVTKLEKVVEMIEKANSKK
jgi:hypothetical protein